MRPPPRLPQHPDDSDYESDASEDDFAIHNESGLNYQLDNYNSTESEEEEEVKIANSSLAPPPVIAQPFPSPPQATDFAEYLTANEYLLFTMCGLTGCIVLAGGCTLCRYCCRRASRRQQHRQPNPPYDDEQPGHSGSYSFRQHYKAPQAPLPPFDYGTGAAGVNDSFGHNSFSSTFSNSTDTEIVHMDVIERGKAKGKGRGKHQKLN